MDADDKIAGPKAIVTILAILALYGAAALFALGVVHG